jgi:hypothetical protein
MWQDFSLMRLKDILTAFMCPRRRCIPAEWVAGEQDHRRVTSREKLLDPPR